MLNELSGNGADMQFRLLNALASSQVGTWNDGNRFSFVAAQSGTFFIAVKDNILYDDTAEGNYAITVRGGDDVMNTTASQATIAGSGSITRSLGQADDEDYFRVTLQAGYAYDFGLTAALGTDADMQIEIWSATGTRLDYNNDGGRVELTPTASGLYYIRVRDNHSSDQAEEGAYTITARMGDTILGSTATTRVISGSGITASDLAQTNDSDWFRVSLTAGRSYGFLLNGDGSANTLDDGLIEIRNAAGARIDFANTGGIATINPTQGGTYYIVVKDGYSYDDAGEGNYRITAMMSDTIVNNTATGSSIAGNASIVSRVDAPQDTDWFRVALREGLSYGFTISGEGTARLSDPDIYLRDTNGASILVYGNNYSSATSTISWTARQSGTYFVQAGNIDESDIGAYRITSVATDTVRNDTETTAVVMDGERRSGRVDVGGDADWFRVNLVAGRDYSFTLAGNGATPRLADRLLTLYDDNGTALRSYSSSGSQSSVITFTAEESGRYYLGAQSYYSGSTGNFTLTVGSNAPRFTGSAASNDMTGNARANTMLGLGGHDTISGLGGNDTLRGGAGSDLLSGGTGIDRLFGDAGADTLNGGVGNDHLTGGAGADLFVFARNGDRDRVIDFADNIDTIRLAGLGVRSVAQAMARADQVGSDVVFDFGRGDVLIIEDTRLAELRNDLVFA